MSQFHEILKNYKVVVTNNKCIKCSLQAERKLVGNGLTVQDQPRETIEDRELSSFVKKQSEHLLQRC